MRKAAAHLGVHRTTALRWRHRFLQCPAKIKDLAMRGVVEADETYVLVSFKGQRQALSHAGRPSRRRGGKARKRGLSSEQIPILVLRANRPDSGLRVAEGSGQGGSQSGSQSSEGPRSGQ